MPRSTIRATAAVAAAALGTAVAAVAAVGPAGAAAAAPARSVRTARPIPASAGHIVAAKFPGVTPPTTATCEARSGVACYSPLQYRRAYDVDKLTGNTGQGRTIVIVDSYGSPTLAADLGTFDDAFGLPPVSLQVIEPAGAVPPYDNSPDRQNWAFETTLDVEYAHAIAPAAKIVVAATPVAETEGVTGFPEIVKAENYVIDHHIGDVISQSFGATEETFPSRQSLLDLRGAVVNAAAHHVSVLAASGDDGATDKIADGSADYPFRVNSWPSSDPLVTSIGGTQLHLDAAGNRTAPDQAWNDGYGAGGGGQSKIFSRPLFQLGVRGVVGSRRGTPDISMTAAVDGGALVYISAFGAGTEGFYIVGGTSEATPIFAGMVALADKAAGRSLGDLNPAIYALGALKSKGIIDVTIGDNSFNGVTGFPATAGYDLATGWGTVDASTFVPQLARLGSVL